MYIKQYFLVNIDLVPYCPLSRDMYRRQIGRLLYHRRAVIACRKHYSIRWQNSRTTYKVEAAASAWRASMPSKSSAFLSWLSGPCSCIGMPSKSKTCTLSAYLFLSFLTKLTSSLPTVPLIPPSLLLVQASPFPELSQARTNLSVPT